MNLLNYTSKEMFSSTELIRKSKTIFDKVNKKEIEKAVILRDGKPSFMLLDFESYEKLMSDYINLKENKEKQNTRRNDSVQKEEIIIEKISDDSISYKETEVINENELNDIDLENALAEIEKLDIGSDKKEASKEESLKEFWD